MIENKSKKSISNLARGRACEVKKGGGGGRDDGSLPISRAISVIAIYLAITLIS